MVLIKRVFNLLHLARLLLPPVKYLRELSSRPTRRVKKLFGTNKLKTFLCETRCWKVRTPNKNCRVKLCRIQKLAKDTPYMKRERRSSSQFKALLEKNNQKGLHRERRSLPDPNSPSSRRKLPRLSRNPQTRLVRNRSLACASGAITKTIPFLAGSRSAAGTHSAAPAYKLTRTFT